MSDASMPHCEKCGRVSYDCECPHVDIDDLVGEYGEIDDVIEGGVWNVGDEDALPDKLEEWEELREMIQSSVADPLTAGMSAATAVRGGAFDELITFAFLSGQSGKKVTQAEMEYVVQYAQKTLADGLLILSALCGTFSLSRKDDQIQIGIRKRFRADLEQRMKEL